MKITILILSLLLALNISYAQKKKSNNNGRKQKGVASWFFASVGGRYGNSMMFNNNVSLTDDVNLSAANPSVGFDFSLGINFPFGIGLLVGFDQSTFNQKYDVYSVEYNTTLKSTGTFILLRVVSENFSYFEIGPKFSRFSDTPAFTTKNMYNSNYTSMIFGVGGSIYWNQNFDISIGARISYGFNLMTNESYPFGGEYNGPAFSTYEKTSAFDAQLRLAFNWHIGYFKEAGCDKHVEFLFF